MYQSILTLNSKPAVPTKTIIASPDTKVKLPNSIVPQLTTPQKKDLTIPQTNANNKDQEYSDLRLSPTPTSQDRANITRMYTQALQHNTNSNRSDTSSVFERKNLVKDIAALYTQNLVKNTPPASPIVSRTKPARDITRLYTGKLNEEPTLWDQSVSKSKEGLKKLTHFEACNF